MNDGSRLTFRECFSRERPMKGWSFLIGLPWGLWCVLHPGAKDLPPSAGIVVPFGLILAVEYVLRFVEWFARRNR